MFNSFIGIDYSGAETCDSSLRGLRVYMANHSSEPREVAPPLGQDGAVVQAPGQVKAASPGGQEPHAAAPVCCWTIFATFSSDNGPEVEGPPAER